LIAFVLPTRSNSRSCRTPQELHLRVGRQLPHLVHEERPLVGQLEAADALLQCAGERPLLVPE
jgi:hypothetical protein